ncbi:MAG TPA: carbohydrate porin [Thermoanaerobaculia bacterium]|nr:carbohydrate porin [Thermoanaerobaculia bacterium]
MELRSVAAVALIFLATRANAGPQAVQPSLVYDGASFDDIAGGVRRGSTYLGTLRLQLTFDGSQRQRVSGTSAFVAVLNKHGGSPSDFAGDAQGVSSLAAPNQWRVEEAWVQQNFFNAQLSALIGRYDLNTEFYRLQSAGLFLNSSFGVGPEFSQSGRSGPSIYPNTSSAIRIGYRPAKSLVLRAAAFNGLMLGEVAYLFRPSGREPPRDIRFRLGRLAGLPPYKAKVSLGAWHYTNSGRSSGIYILGDRTIYENGARRLAAFGQLGIGDARAQRFARYIGTGIVIAAPFKGRDQDEIGLAVAAVRNSGQYNIQQSEIGAPMLRGETTVECTYLTPLTPHIALQPDLQYVVHPSADRSRKNALVMMIHFEISR